MKKSLIIVSAVGILIGAVGIAAQGIYGSWAMPAMSQGPFTFQATMTFAKDTISIKNVCTLNGQSSDAQVTVPAAITDRSVTVLAAKEDHQTKNGVDCNVSIAPSTMDYSVSGDDASLTLSMPGQGSFVLHRQ